MDITRYSDKKVYILVALLLAVFMVTAVSTALKTSATCDEVAHHVASGYSYLKTADFRMNPSAPPLIREIMAAPLLLMDLKLPVDHVSWDAIDSPVFGRLFFFEYNSNAEEIIFWSRVPIILLGVFMGLLIFQWSRRIYGTNAGILALFLYAYSPAMLGNSAIAMVDIGGSFFILLAVYQYWSFLKNENKGFLAILVTGVCFGLAQASKVTSVILYPLFFVLALTQLSRVASGKVKELAKQIWYLIAIFFIGLLILWATYGFEFKPLLVGAPDIEEKVQYIRHFLSMVPFLNSPAIIERVINYAHTVPIPLSTYAVTFLGITNQVVAGGQGVFFFGQKYLTGIRAYYVVALLIKTPITVIVLFFSSVIFALFKKRSKVDLQTNAFLILPMAVLFVMVSFSRLQGAIRYLLPAYPFLFIWLSDIVNVRFEGRVKEILAKAALGLLLAWYVFISFTTFPHYLGYFNEIVGERAHKVSHDSDWGQDLPALSEYLKENNIEKVKLFYFGEDSPSRCGIIYEEFTEEERISPRKEVYAISIRWLPAVEWTETQEPTAKLGGSIFIYDFRE
ncbi:ArnT family glycosyltransferase [Candidatus Omnitrophota bacterium]